MKKSLIINKISVLLVTLLLVLSAFQTASAQRPQSQTTVSSIPKDKRIWSGFPWLIGAGLAAAAIALALKSSKRTHLD